MNSQNYTPNVVPFGKRIWNAAAAIFLLFYGAIGLYLNDLYVPGKHQPGIHFHGTAAWVMYCSILCVCANLVSVIVDHYDHRNNEIRYINFSYYAESTAWIIFFSALSISLFSSS